jgi:hypothetical protein
MLKRWLVSGCLVALAVLMAASSVAAETLMMPKRDARKGTQVIVWGVTTLPVGSGYTFAFGDGVTAAGIVNDQSYVAVSHTYATAGNYTATMTITNGATTEVGSVAVQVFDGALLTPDASRSLDINMAIEDGLRYLWTAQSNRQGNFPNGVTTEWGGTYAHAAASLVVLAFENHGYQLPNSNAAPTGLYEKYVVRRGLNYIVDNLYTRSLNVQAAGDPCAGGVEAAPCTGLYAARVTTDWWSGALIFDHTAYMTGVAILPIAASGALSRTVSEVPGAASSGYVAGKTLGEILQRMSNSMVWGQIDSCSGRGGWGYELIDGCNNADGSTIGWGVLGLFDAGAAGAIVPAFAKSEMLHAINGGINSDGSLDYQSDADPNSFNNVGIEKGGVALQMLFFNGTQAPFAAGSTGANVVKYISDRWMSGRIGNDTNWGCQVGSQHNFGCAYSMFNSFKGLKLQGINTLAGSTRPAGPGSQPAGDWYAEYQDWLVANQTSPNDANGGYWGSMQFSCCDGGTQMTAAIAELILSPVALVLPDPIKFSSVGLSPKTASAIEGGNHTVTAKAESTTGTPVPGATVTFKVISGPNTGVNGTGVTDANGEASFTYTDAGPDGTTGTDEIQAYIGNLASNIVKMEWLPKNRPPVAVDDNFTTNEDTPLAGSVVGNDSDPDGDTLTASLVSTTSNGLLVFNADGSFLYTPNLNWFGTDTFTYKLNDGKVDSNVATVTIQVASVNDDPSCAAAAPSISSIWPPNHRLVDVDVLGVVDPVEGTVVTISITSIFQDEPTNTVGDGNTAIDGFGLGTTTAQVRAERSGSPKVPGNGRVYHISFTGKDADGGTCTGVVKVGVPHDQGQRSIPVDDGPLFKSTGGN